MSGSEAKNTEPEESVVKETSVIKESPVEDSKVEVSELKDPAVKVPSAAPTPAASTSWISLRNILSISIIIIALLASPRFFNFDFGQSTPCETSYLILTAHPDDEAMFFAPTILSLVNAGCPVRGLCLSEGNESGLGRTRKEELVASYEALGVKKEFIEILDHPELQDGPTKDWPKFVIDNIVSSYLSMHHIDTIITFDQTGISQHPNHIAVSRVSAPRREIWKLQSPSILSKYTGPLSVISHYLPFSQSTSTTGKKGKKGKKAKVVKIKVFTTSPFGWARGVWAMTRHKTQLVWFRWLYLAASRLMWINEFEVVAG
ncbi:putative deacetylase LmbE-like domain-containing protein [Naematelia encephala]|uniref:N-acetylglucosaminylphosphatidylinositol deacetylase n=1 Tax=Naematelia encephala TaxID=71784 RepID=A0A1Y2BHK7_9TREE|nr:putative deacetylase LmbE-like domain-containing protein [Naematelia encephala]